MIDLKNFRIWMTENKSYSDKTISDIVSRFKRACSFIPWNPSKFYLQELDKNEEYLKLSTTVRSQLKNSVKLYNEFYEKFGESIKKRKRKLKVLSLFSNIGVAEAYFEGMGIDVVVANEIEERRAILYSKIYPNTHMICGDIRNEYIKEKIVKESMGVDVIMATPPCQGMSTAGKQDKDDERNKLILDVIDIVEKINPKYVFIENVPLFYNTELFVNNKYISIPNLISEKLGNSYEISRNIINTENYSVPQRRERAIMLFTRRDQDKVWEIPEKEEKIITMEQAIGFLPPVDPFVKDVSKEEMIKMFPKYEERKEAALKFSKWHKPPQHIKRQVVVMQHTPTGKTAFDNKEYFPIKENGEAVKGYKNTYKRQNWDTTAYTVTMDNRKISSQNNVHPGRLEYIDKNGEEIYSDPRTLTLYELMLVMSLPSNWNIPENVSEAFIRRIIGEGIPPMFIKKVFENII